MKEIRIPGRRPYEAVIGPVEAGLERLTGRGAPILVSEPRLFALHGVRVAEALGAEPLLVPEGEAAKDWTVLHNLLADFARLGANRDTIVVALGGGSVGDVAGLAASLFKRGCPVVHVPTTLLAQADSAIGGKTAIDAFGEKNVIGSFHEPALVIVDPDFLDTLDARQLLSGYAEIVKYGLIDQPGFFAWCEDNGGALLAGHRGARQRAIAQAIESKARIVAGDLEDRSGQRALLNLGHSFAHAIEAEAGLGRLLHGEAVAIGLALAFKFSAAMDLCPLADCQRVAFHLKRVGLPTRLGDVGLSARSGALVQRMLSDKKNVGGALRLVLAHGIGKTFLHPGMEAERLAAFLARED
ncbi:3-dehydroquinate synthase family protein [Sphingomonas xanthus]|uniref:3-dehydroquinate synthase n=1 Tax=Sphingomonas xanthus TaxID=2594473 RepID=A0A516ITC7_9SPHN|nr:3-dehydroquinate synthase family protein [Sphingomonas xanthus]QDP20120.1 3-dehydroquinate synthase [Sphingomonas xanthus]